MKTTLNELYYATKTTYELQLLAGEDGLSVPVSWVYIAEDTANDSFFRPGQLLITTGLSASEDKGEWLLSFLRMAKDRGTSGLIVNTGRYISEEMIPDEVLQFCDIYGYPLFTMPWHIHIEDISRDYCSRILTDSKKPDYSLSTLLGAVSDPDLAGGFIRHHLSAVLDYDATHKSALLETLYFYLQTGKSTQKTAEAAFCHRNTINYRVKLLRQLLLSSGLDLDDAETCHALYAACLLFRQQELSLDQ